MNDSCASSRFAASIRASIHPSLRALLVVGCCAGAACAPPAADDTTVALGGVAGAMPASPAAGSRCATDLATGDLSCSYQTVTVGGRPVLWQTPLGAAPAAGWPIALVFQGSFFAPDKMWSAKRNDLLGILGTYTQTQLVQRLLDGGYAVVTPQADLGATAWDTNLVPWRDLWLPAPDNRFLGELFAAIDGGLFGPVDHARWYATGVSSGGYMTSRMAVSYPGRFRALAVVAGSYATCGGIACFVPATLPADHAPTLFLHGGRDLIVPPFTMYAYRDKLVAMGRATRTVVDPTFMHGWIPATPAEVGAWFDAH